MRDEIKKAIENVGIVKEWYSKHNGSDYPLSNFAAVELLDELGVI